MKLRVGGNPQASMETRELRAQHSQSLTDLRDHRRRCVQCIRAVRRRNGKFCVEGDVLHELELELKGKVQENAKADAAPIPGQETLIGEDECR